MDGGIKGIPNMFNKKNRKTTTMFVRSLLRTSAGLAADVGTAGMGGDVLVDSAFAVLGSAEMIKGMEEIVRDIIKLKPLFKDLIIIDRYKRIPIVSKITLDNGFDYFEKKFEKIFKTYIDINGTSILNKMYDKIIDVLDKITTAISDWLACLFPDTAGLAGDISKILLDSVVKNGYTYVYHIVGNLSQLKQQMITDDYSLKRYIKIAILKLKKLLQRMSLNDIMKMELGKIPYIGKFAQFAPMIGPSGIADKQLRSGIIYAIDNYIYPHIGDGVNLFNQLFPLFLMFALFVEKYSKLSGHTHTQRKNLYKQRKAIHKQKKIIRKQSNLKSAKSSSKSPKTSSKSPKSPSKSPKSPSKQQKTNCKK
jgi:hypothetical protein